MLIEWLKARDVIEIFTVRTQGRFMRNKENWKWIYENWKWHLNAKSGILYKSLCSIQRMRRKSSWVQATQSQTQTQTHVHIVTQLNNEHYNFFVVHFQYQYRHSPSGELIQPASYPTTLLLVNCQNSWNLKYYSNKINEKQTKSLSLSHITPSYTNIMLTMLHK